MSLLDNVGKLTSNVGNKLGSISTGLDAVTGIAKGILCLPTLLSGLVSSIPSIINGISAGVANLVNGAVAGYLGAVEGLVNQKIQVAVNKVNGVFNEALGALGLIAGTVNDIFAFARDAEAKILDLLNFTANKDNCSFAIAELDKCVNKQVNNTITTRSLKNIASNELASPGLVGSADITPEGTLDPKSSKNLTVSSASGFIAKNISDPGGLVDNLSQKHIKCMQRAENIATKVNSII